MKNVIVCLFAAASMSACAEMEMWSLKMSLQIPAVHDNAESQGYRKYRTERIEGKFIVDDTAPAPDGEPSVTLVRLENKTHKVNGRPVNYQVDTGEVKWHAVGSNRTGKFSARSVSLHLDCYPNYSLTEPTDDNSLILTLAGKGGKNSVTGRVAGNLGCSCSDYGHTSPTRIYGTTNVTDVAAVYGPFTMRKVKVSSNRKD